ncbi:Protein kinase domain-containing protein [Psidium guajava]|nr:Protein kinase domain-containing protein [Psidium guajava]
MADNLHHQCQTAVIHCDLNPSNILLDPQMNGHVSDFGLARIFPNPTGDLPVSQTSSIRLRGTLGYAPPEYGLGSEVSKDGDGYSYEVLLLEIFTGKRPTHDKFKDALNLHDHCLAAWQERVAYVADQPLLVCDTEESSIADTRSNQRNISAHQQECLVIIFDIGDACSAELPRERMNISDAVTRLR